MVKGPAKRPKVEKTLTKSSQVKASGMLDMIAALMDQVETSRSTPELDEAQEIAFDAMEAPTRTKRVALARKALAISPLCADAYSVLATEAESPADEILLLRQAVEAGEKALGETAFDEDVGMFWGLLETRPYMRARQALAGALWDQGERDEAIETYRDMLRLNPNDNQGVRYSLLYALLELGRDAQAAELIKRYKDDGAAAWAWSKALLEFRRKGDAAGASKALSQAVEANAHVAGYLLGRKRLPKQQPDFFGFGDENEAVAYVFGADAAWVAAEGAKRWLETSAVPPRPAGVVKDQGDGGAPTKADRIDDAVLALLLLGLHGGDRAWKGFDWDALGRLHGKGLIENPVGKAKSVEFTQEGLRLAKALHEKLFGDGEGPAS